jgi:hypothetical protein
MQQQFSTLRQPSYYRDGSGGGGMMGGGGGDSQSYGGGPQHRTPGHQNTPLGSADSGGMYGQMGGGGGGGGECFLCID